MFALIRAHFGRVSHLTRPRARATTVVDCNDVKHNHRHIGGGYIDDGCGCIWQPCIRPDCDLHVVRPGKAECSGESDNVGCPRDTGELIDRLYGEVARLALAGDNLANGVRTGRWDDSLDAWDEVRRGGVSIDGDVLDEPDDTLPNDAPRLAAAADRAHKNRRVAPRDTVSRAKPARCAPPPDSGT